MKKFYYLTICVALIGLNGFAQSLSLITKQGEVLPQNATIYQPSNVGELELVTYFDVKNLATKPIDVICKKVILQQMDSTSTTMCWAANCYPEWITVSPPQTMEGGEISTEFSGHYLWMGTKQIFTPGETHIRWVFYDEDNPNDSVSLLVYYTTYGVGIADSKEIPGSIHSVYPNPATSNTTIGYSIPQGAEGSMVLRDMLGAAVKTVALSASSGKVNMPVADLAEGIYFCTLLIDGKMAQTKKLVIRK